MMDGVLDFSCRDEQKKVQQEKFMHRLGSRKTGHTAKKLKKCGVVMVLNGQTPVIRAPR